MWIYERRMQYPINIKRPSAKLAQAIISQYGGPNGEMGASTRYLSQRFAMPYSDVIGLLTDVGTEELGHCEMISAIVYQLVRGLTTKEIEDSGLMPYYIDHTMGIYPASSAGDPFNAATLQSVGDPIADLTENLAAEQKARVTYDNILRLIDDPDVMDPIKFLREREIVHFQRFGEAIENVRQHLDSKNIYFMNPAFDPAAKLG